MEKSGRIAVYLFDKTGTLTEGKWRLIRVATAGGFSEKKAIALAAGLEGSSDHYIAAEIRACAKARRIEPASISEIQVFENGISGFFQGIPVKIGSAEFLKDELITSGEVDIGNENRGEALVEAEQSRIYMSYEGKPCASLVFSDRLKKGSVDAVDRLRRKGYRLALVSGDSAGATARIAEKVGIKDVYGGKLPLEKAELVRQLREKSGGVAMVGDGINDAPAMVCADLAVAMHSGNDLGKQAAHVTLMRDDPGQLLDFIDIAGRVEKKVYQNLSWAFFYNAAGIPIAASGLLTPVIAVCAMLLSSLSVIGNTLLLVWGKPKGEKEKRREKRFVIDNWS
jgi:cation transport ATPase